MATSPRLFNPRLDWVIFLTSVGFSLTLLFFGKNPALNAFKRDAAGVFTAASKPLVLARRTFDLWQENSRLRDLALSLSDENGQLRDAMLENQRLRAMLEFRQRFPLSVHSADVVAVPGPEIGGKLMIDAGSAEGVTTNSAVLTPEGLVGKVVEVARHTALVQSLVGNAYGVPVMLERSRVGGILKWMEPGHWTIVGLATGEDIRTGDLVLTAGSGLVFPKGIRVGVVTDVKAQGDPKGGFCRVTPFVDFSAVEEVFVVMRMDSLGTEPELNSEKTRRLR